MRISIREVEKALKDPEFKKSLPPELDTVIAKYEKNPSCPCNIPIYNKILKYGSKQLRNYFPGKDVVEPDEELLKIAENHWFVINCHVDELENKLKELAPGRKQLAVSRWQDQVTVVVNELDYV